MAAKTGVVLGYGCDLTPQLQKYLLHVVKVARAQNLKYMILLGGYTQQATHPDNSEAGVMFEFLRHRLRDCLYSLENNSVTTIQNIEAIKRMAEQKQLRYPDDDIIIFCEYNRRHKVAILAWLILPEFRGRIKVEPVFWEVGLMPMLKQVVSTVGEVAALYIKPLNKIFHRQRLAKTKTA